METLASQGVALDIGHGQGSFHYPSARAAIERGLLPTTISTDLHIGCVWGPVWDLATTMSKMTALGMSREDIIDRVTTHPARVLGLEDWGKPAVGTPARFTVFDVLDSEENLPDSFGNFEPTRQLFEPRYTIVGTNVTPAARNTERRRSSVSIVP
jgi:dihydroorotase